MCSRLLTFAAVGAALVSCVGNVARASSTDEGVTPRIVNIVNFVRLTEPREEAVTDRILYETTAAEAALMERYGLRGTFLLQYDALMNVPYQELMRSEQTKGNEVGAWWEITKPHVEKAGMQWRGRYPWDWHANVGFTTGYTPSEREKLVDVYMEDFKAIFGRYPSSVGSWYIDAHTLSYMYDRYGIQAACICRDQIGTDGYTLWGGYWTGGYYPSRTNSYMPAQQASGQIPVPVFRMLGSDPIYQYDNGIGGTVQAVETLEPVYPESGGNPRWMRYYFQSAFTDPAAGFTYTQAGQENSFTWAAIEQGLSEQLRMLDSLKNTPGLRIETLGETGRWFRDRYDVTPASSLTALDDVRGEGRRTVWFDSRYYRANVLWEEGAVRIRDVHMFDGRVTSPDHDRASNSTQFTLGTLPVMDGFRWSMPERKAGIYFSESIPGIGHHIIKCDEPHSFTTDPDGAIAFEWNDTYGYRSFRMRMDEATAVIEGYDPQTGELIDNWFLSLITAREKGNDVPFTVIVPERVTSVHDGTEYHLSITDGSAALNREDTPPVFNIYPRGGKITLRFDERQ